VGILSKEKISPIKAAIQFANARKLIAAQKVLAAPKGILTLQV